MPCCSSFPSNLDFRVALMYDEDDSNPEDSTGTVINDLQYAYADTYRLRRKSPTVPICAIRGIR